MKMRTNSDSSTPVALFILFLISPLSSVTALLQLPISPSNQAEKLIRELNLFPKESINIVHDRNFSNRPKIVEKAFKLPHLIDTAGVSLQELGHHAGYYQIQHSHAARMFYFFFESRNSKEDPVVIWLTGGPGCSSEMALFYENGPFSIANNLSLEWNAYGWDKVIFIFLLEMSIYF
ncbi:serine carboxypeptidase-like [Olea europaea subsp. europaea]|uniref:Serine carboxypeptidase-like n=1 Tax=Olea europaea subsp. europaea TaxID=158383 RepID=A0A8S0SBT5_OLEEU|nr:serine carboxypeptidase-like [Olea europaea subsp. europaea]